MKTKKTLISVFAIIALVAVLVVSCVACQQIKDGADKAKDKANELVDKAKDKVNNLELAVENNPRLSLAMADGAGSVDPVIKATVTSELIEDKRVSWNVAFAEETSENVNDYITLTVSEDTTTVTLKANPFNKVIIITAASVVYPEIKATCTCNYRAKIKSDIGLTDIQGNTLSTSSVYKLKPLVANNVQLMRKIYGFDNGILELLASEAKTIHTVDVDRFDINYFIKPSDGLYAELKKQGLAKESNSSNCNIGNLTGDKRGISLLDFYNGVCFVELIPGGDYGSEVYDNIRKFNTAVVANTSDYDMTLTVGITASFCPVTNFRFNMKIDRDGISPSNYMSISLSNSDLTF